MPHAVAGQRPVVQFVVQIDRQQAASQRLDQCRDDGAGVRRRDQQDLRAPAVITLKKGFFSDLSTKVTAGFVAAASSRG